jgi:Ca2+-binding RTX toxin-like protein
MHGGRGDDTLKIAEDGGGLLYGDWGDDRVIVGNGIHKFVTIRLDGGSGNDSYAFASLRPDPVSTLVAGRGFDILDLSPLNAQGATVDLAGCPGCVEAVIGTAADDHITGDAFSEVILGGDGNDVLDGGGGQDVIAGQNGDDTIAARDGVFDTVGCGAGIDAVVADRFDAVGNDCESVSPAAGGGAPLSARTWPFVQDRLRGRRRPA